MTFYFTIYICDIMTKRNARYEILGRHFYDCFTLFTTNKTKLGLKTYRNDKILLDYIVKETKYSREKLFNYLNKNKISYVVIDSDNTYTIKRFSNKNYLRAKRNSYANVTQ